MPEQIAWVYQEYGNQEPSLEMVYQEFNDLGQLAEMYPNAIYFYAGLVTE